MAGLRLHVVGKKVVSARRARRKGSSRQGQLDSFAEWCTCAAHSYF